MPFKQNDFKNIARKKVTSGRAFVLVTLDNDGLFRIYADISNLKDNSNRHERFLPNLYNFLLKSIKSLNSKIS